MNQHPKQSWAEFRESKNHLAQGTSTLSKAAQYEDVEPALIARGKGCRVWDLDGNEYIDFRCGLGPVTLGYGVPEINDAIAAQLQSGICFGHPHPLEGEVAELLTEVIPCAERVRFLKTGGEAVAATHKIARAATGREKILQCGYNGWLNNLNTNSGFQPAAIAAGNPTRGVPRAVSALHCSLPWGELEPWEEAFARDGNDIAAVTIACNYPAMEKATKFLPAIRELTRRHGTLMIMDEIVTGFRLALGGAQEYFGVTADMAVFGKGLANGMPLSAFVGRGDLIDSARELGISSTFGGEALSLAAAKAAIAFYRKHKVIDYLWTAAGRMWGETRRLLETHKFPARIRGRDVCPAFQFDRPEQIAVFFKAAYRNGLSLYAVPYMTWSHRPEDIDEALKRMEQAIIDAKREMER